MQPYTFVVQVQSLADGEPHVGRAITEDILRRIIARKLEQELPFRLPIVVKGLDEAVAEGEKALSCLASAGRHARRAPVGV